MAKFTSIFIIFSTFGFISCNSSNKEQQEIVTEEPKIASEIIDSIPAIDPQEKLKQAYQLFKEGNDQKSIELANEVLAIGRTTKNDTLVGQALTSLCRNAQRKLDTLRLAELSAELVTLSEATGNQKWMMYRAHMNAEMWRLIGNMDKAEAFYNESMDISFKIGATGMYTIDHFNKSFVSIAKGNYSEARTLINKYYLLATPKGEAPQDAYGLIALAYLLEQEQNYHGAHEVATVTRKLFKEQNIFPEPPDEKPLLAVEKAILENLDEVTRQKISKVATSESVKSLLEKYLEL
ncbi:MAG: hypothetical protein N4A35_02485 [Flavobacteriales bacterium]|jgi:tetratricopeptide (TPR) repeat protein|nr:hypothetical protein [Flavobacteriales bacterium]